MYQRGRALTDHGAAPIAHPETHIETQPLKASTINPPPAHDPSQNLPPGPTIPDGPAPGPAAAPDLVEAEDAAPDEPPLSPYTFTRQRLRELTMPPIPNFDIPDSPPPPERNSEEAAALAATTKQFERFLELKKQGVHFNARLQDSSSLRNPSLLPKLMAFAGISEEDAYRSSLPEELAVPVRWPEDCYGEELVRQSERYEKKRLAERDKVDFVPAAQRDGGSASGTPGRGGRKSKFGR